MSEKSKYVIDQWAYFKNTRASISLQDETPYLH